MPPVREHWRDSSLPENPYFAGQTLHYYWFYHLWPAAIIDLSGVTARSAVALTLPATLFFSWARWPAC